MAKIKSFIYLDEYKMYSISSQIFEGLTEYVINYSADANQDIEQQKGPIGSGRILADIISKESGTEERKFLHDYSYTLFEKKLLEDDRVIVIDPDNISENIDKIGDCNFIKITGRILFNDIQVINNTLKHFNEFGEAIAYATTFNMREKLKAECSEVLEKTKDRNVQANIKNKLKSEINVSKIAKESNMYLDPELIDKLTLILNYGYKDQFEVQISLPIENKEKIIFSANLDRKYLKENETLLIKKHSRYSEKNFVVFGMITQNQRKVFDSQDQSPPKEPKEFLVYMTSKLSEVEEKFTGRLSNEVIIDPIAVYREV